MPFKEFISTFDANHGLGSQPLFWVAITYPIGLFFSTGSWAWVGLELEITSKGFNQFIEISKLPLGLLALSIPLAVLTARLHGTKQTALQIEKANEQIANTEKQIIETQQKNKTDLYIAHYNHFQQFIESCISTYESLFDSKLKKDLDIRIDIRLLYSRWYPNSSIHYGVGAFNSKASEELLDTLSELNELASSILFNCKKTDPEQLKLNISAQFSNIALRVSNQLYIENNGLGLFKNLTLKYRVPFECYLLIREPKDLYHIIEFFKMFPTSILNFELSEQEILDRFKFTSQQFETAWNMDKDIREDFETVYKSLKINHHALENPEAPWQ